MAGVVPLFVARWMRWQRWDGNTLVLNESLPPPFSLICSKGIVGWAVF